MTSETSKFAVLLVCTVMVVGRNYYHVIHDHGVVEEFNKEVYNPFIFRNSMFNRTTRTFSFDFTLLIELNSTYKAYHFKSNQYHSFVPMRFELRVCDLFKTNAFGIADVTRQSSNVIPKCPVPKGQYSIRHLTYDGSSLPPNLPYEKYKMTLLFHFGKVNTLKFSWYGELREPLPSP